MYPGLDHIQRVFRRNRKALAVRPSLGRGTAVTRVRMKTGMAGEIVEGDRTIPLDATVNGAGHDTAPNPGFYGRGAIGSCVAQAFLLRAADEDLPVDGVEVTVEADYDGNGLHGTADVHAGNRAFRVRIDVASPADPAAVEEVVNLALDHCPWLENARRPIPVEPTLSVTTPSGGSPR